MPEEAWGAVVREQSSDLSNGVRVHAAGAVVHGRGRDGLSTGGPTAGHLLPVEAHD